MIIRDVGPRDGFQNERTHLPTDLKTGLIDGRRRTGARRSARRFFGGLGGCPFAPGATGNVATEELVYLFDGLTVETGVRLSSLVHATYEVGEFLQTDLASNVARAMRAAQHAA